MVCARRSGLGATAFMPRDLKRLVRALEVFFQTGQPLTAHFADTVSPLPADCRGYRRRACAARDAAGRAAGGGAWTQQFEAGLLDEMRALLAAGRARRRAPFGGLVYRQAMDICTASATRRRRAH